MLLQVSRVIVGRVMKTFPASKLMQAWLLLVCTMTASGQSAPPAPSQTTDALERGRAALRSGQLEQAFQAFQQSAAAGNPDAMSHVCYMYAEGRGGSQNYEQALEWLRRAAAAGNVNSMTNLGILYSSGRGVIQDYQQAREWFEKGATGGEPTAMFSLGVLFEEGHGIAQDYQQARHWFEKAAVTRNAKAINNVGYLENPGLAEA